jgi:hypothetical protein
MARKRHAAEEIVAKLRQLRGWVAQVNYNGQGLPSS